jgi:hypothetical protein
VHRLMGVLEIEEGRIESGQSLHQTGSLHPEAR